MGLVEAIITLLAGTGVFMVGMKLMSDGLEHGAGGGLKKLFRKISGNRFAGVGVGAAVTAIIQSSSATTVMVIGFVNAGIMTLLQATAIIMGANIGTTITGIIVAFSSFNVGLYATALTLVGVFITLFGRKDKIKTVGNILSGLGLIFVGLSMMSGSLKNCEEIRAAFSSLFAAVDFPLLLILLGAVFTALIQSSSAATGIIITLVSQGVLSVEGALFIVIGTNIGTCVTALLASIGATVNAKRAALIHLMFNLIGSVVFAAIIWPLSGHVVMFLGYLAPNAMTMQIAWFHIFFNVITTLLLIPFTKQLAKFASVMIPDKHKDAEQLKLFYIDDRILQTPSIALEQTVKEVVNMAEIARENLNRGFNAVCTGKTTEKEKLYAEENKIDFINTGVAAFLIKLSAQSVGESDEKVIGSLHHVIGDIERIGDYAKNFMERAESMQGLGIAFSEQAQSELRLMYDKVESMFGDVLKVFSNRDATGLASVSETEALVDKLKKELNQKHVERLNAGSCSVEKGIYFYAIISELERTADHLINIAYSIKNPSGSEDIKIEAYA